MKPKIQLFHFTRTPGVVKINDIEKRKMYLQTRDHPIVYYFLTNYRYLEETRQIRHKALVIFIPCNNCNEHKVDPENCEFILDSENRISGFSFVRKFNRKSGTYYMVKNDFLGNFMNIFSHRQLAPFLYYNKEKFFQTYEISKEFDFNYITPYNFLDYPPIWGPHSASKKTIYLSIFCPVSEKEIQLRIKNITEQVTIKYGWTMFCV